MHQNVRFIADKQPDVPMLLRMLFSLSNLYLPVTSSPARCVTRDVRPTSRWMAAKQLLLKPVHQRIDDHR